MLRRRIVTWEENNVHSAMRHVYTRYQRAGKASAAKIATNRRERHEGAQAIREGRYDAL